MFQLSGFYCRGLRLRHHFRKHVRSPELFDELVLADGKNFAWAPRANKITGRWFDQIKSVKNVTTNLLFLKSEEGSMVYDSSCLNTCCYDYSDN